MTVAALVSADGNGLFERGDRGGIARLQLAPGSRPFLVGRGAIRRPRLLKPLSAPDAPPFVVLIAPAGYGKTTLLEQWAERDPRPFARLSLSEADNEPGRLQFRVAHALAPARERAVDGRVVLALDDLDALHGRAAFAALATLVGSLPAETTLALASRSEPPLPIARLRAQRLVAELRARELAMTRSEAAMLFQRAGVQLDQASIELLLSRTEGWPAGLTLAALWLEDQGGAGGALARFGGEDRLVADYLRDEVLATLSPGLRDFVLRTSVLDVLTGPLCDAVLQRSGSAAVLAELARSNVLMVPMDRTDEHYRYHRLLAQTLRAELRRSMPGIVPELNRRASEWCRRSGDVDGGVRYALCAGDTRAAGEHVRAGSAWTLAEGRSATLEHWLGRFAEHELATDPWLAAAAAVIALARGQGHVAEHWQTAAAAAAPPDGGGEIEAAVGVLRAAVARGGVLQMRDDAARAYSLARADSPWRAPACLLCGTADALAGDRGRALRQLEEAARRAAVTAPHLHALSLAQLAVLELVEEDWEAAASLITRARAQVERYSLGADAPTALVFAASAVVRARRGRIEEARGDLREAIRLDALLTDFAPWFEAELHILMARAALRLSDAAGARALLARAARHAERTPEATVLTTWIEDGWEQCDAFTGRSNAVTTSLTTAELRILGYLPTHLSFREIAERTYVSANTVKTQANAVYRKLDVSCRSEAVARAREAGLIDA